MGETKERLLQESGTAFIEHNEKGFYKIRVLLEATGGLSLSQVCAVTGLEASTIQNWVKRGWVAHPKGKKYEEIQIARILIINALKECIKLEHIALLMGYVNNYSETNGEITLKESELYNYLYEALQKTGQADDLSRSGVESVVEKVIKDYRGPTPEARIRIRKALTLMIYACVCTDVKRRTEAMMGQILYDIEHPESVAAEADEAQNTANKDEPETQETEPAAETRKTVSQALREWDISSVERIISEDDAEEKTVSAGVGNNAPADEKPSYRPWYFRKNTK